MIGVSLKQNRDTFLQPRRDRKVKSRQGESEKQNEKYETKRAHKKWLFVENNVNTHFIW